MKNLIYFLVLVLSLSSLKADYWMKMENLPASHADNYWLDVYFYPDNPNLGWVCGFSGQTLRTTDGGNTWTGGEVSVPLNLESIHFPTPDIGYTSGTAGIYKSTDGGVTWNDITPLTAGRLWGNFFIDENYGVVIGGGCFTQQQFYHTTNGGASWTLQSQSIGGTGLTDAIIYEKDGLAYAVSSGNLWISDDGGRTWNLHKNTGSNVWQEELTNIGNSFLLPYAGTICTGGGPDGGMRFSTDGGDNWNEHSTGKPMFGTFLIDETTGWACGNDRGVYYTTDAGLTWEAKNCGIESGDLDDIWFNSPDDGWVVGSGVFKLAPDDYSVSKDLIDFGDVCPEDEKLDSIIIKNLSFDESTVQMELLGDSQDFIIYSNPNFSLSECGDYKFQIGFNPQTLGQKNATLRITFNLGKPTAKIYNVVLRGNAIESTAYPQDTLIIANPIPVGEITQIPSGWNADNEVETIEVIEKFPPTSEIVFNHQLPVKIFNGGVILYFNINPIDTGWVETRMKFTFGPCERDTFVTVRAYAVSPIIESDPIMTFIPECINSITDTIEIKNNGNAVLNIDDSFILDPDNEFTFIEWLNSQEPFTIEPGKSEYAVINYTIRRGGDFLGEFHVVNNDSTKARGDRNPYIIELLADPEYTDVFSKIDSLDFGNVCIGDNLSREFLIYNLGTIDALANYNSLIDEFNIEFPNNNFTILRNDSLEMSINFEPSDLGDFRDTLFIRTQPCGDSILVILKGRGVSNDFTLSPLSIDDFVDVGEVAFIDIELVYNGNSPANIEDIVFNSIPSGWTVEIIEPDIGTQIQPDETITVKLRILATTIDVFKTDLCILVSGLCQDEECIAIEISSRDRGISVTDRIDFGLTTCSSNEQTQEILIQSQTTITDTITNIYLKDAIPEFRLAGLPQFDYEIPGEEEYTFNIIFDANDNEGVFRDTIVVETIQPGGQILEIPVSAEFRRTRTVLLSPDDGLVIEENYYFADLGIFERCEDPIILTFELENSGTLNDEVKISMNSADAYALSDNSLSISSQSTNTFQIRFEPSMLGTGINNADILITSDVCPLEINIELTSELIEPILTIVSEQNIQFPELWFDRVDTREVIVRNNSTVARTIYSVEFDNQLPVFLHDLDVPVTIQPNDEITFNVTFSSILEGGFSDKLIIEEGSSCSDIHEISVYGTVPEEKYFIDIALDDHVVDIGDTVTVHMELLQEIINYTPEKYRFDISFNEKLIYPRKVLIRNSNLDYSDIQFMYDEPGILSFEVDENLSSGLLDTTGIIAKIEFLTLAYLPESTDVTLDTIGIFRDKDFTYNKKDGSIEITNFCRPVLEFGYLFNPEFDAKYSELSNGSQLPILINATGDQNITTSLKNILGEKIFTIQQKINEGENNITLDLNTVPSGTYFIEFESEFGIKQQGKLLIVK